METKPSSSPVVDSTRDKLCREIAERTGRNIWLKQPMTIEEQETIVLVGIRELYDKAYDKGHDAGARERDAQWQKFLAIICAETDPLSLPSELTCEDLVRFMEGILRKAAIRAGRE